MFKRPNRKKARAVLNPREKTPLLRGIIQVEPKNPGSADPPAEGVKGLELALEELEGGDEESHENMELNIAKVGVEQVDYHPVDSGPIFSTRNFQSLGANFLNGVGHPRTETGS